MAAEEKARYDSLIQTNIESYRNLLEFLQTSEHVLFSARNEIKRTIQYLKSNERYAPIFPLCTALSIQLEAVDKEIADEVPADMKFLGRGAYGCVVEPALPNRIDKTWETHPGDVTKLFVNKYSANSAIEKAEIVYNTFGDSEQRMIPYTQVYSSSNLPANIQAQCSIPPDTNLYGARMPNLGVSLFSIDDYAQKIRAMPFTVIIRQVLKLFSQVKIIHDRGYIHGDIRTPNVMINPDTGIMTLIDFDLFQEKAQFFINYDAYLGYYNTPPESLLNENLKSFLSGNPLQAAEDPVKLRDYVKFNAGSLFNTFSGRQYTEQMVHLANTSNIEIFRHIQSINEYQDSMFESFDCYGLGLSLLDFFVGAYGYNGTEKQMYLTLKDSITNGGSRYRSHELKAVIHAQYRIIAQVLVPAISLLISDRITITHALEKIEEIYEEFKAGYAQPSRSARTTPNSARTSPNGGKRKTRKQRFSTSSNY